MTSVVDRLRSRRRPKRGIRVVVGDGVETRFFPGNLITRGDVDLEFG